MIIISLKLIKDNCVEFICKSRLCGKNCYKINDFEKAKNIFSSKSFIFGDNELHLGIYLNKI